MNVTFQSIDEMDLAGVAIACGVFASAALSNELQALDLRSGGAVARVLASGRFRGEVGEVLELPGIAGIDAATLILVGCGCESRLQTSTIEQATACALRAAEIAGARALVLVLAPTQPDLAAHSAFAARLAAYRFEKYRTVHQAGSTPVHTIRIAVNDPTAAARAYDPLTSLGDGILMARDLVSEPPNVLFPEAFAQRMRALEDVGVEVEILGEQQMRELSMNALLGVGQGSARESQLVVLKWFGAERRDDQPVALVGKGVCFDTGGLNLKPLKDMRWMKEDMAGAAAVAGAFRALAGRKARANVIGILGLVENMPDGKAQRPGDVVTSLSGQTIEVVDPDCEGRLVLADALSFCLRNFAPKIVIDIATLTDAVVVALGDGYAGMFSNDDALAERVLSASAAATESVWRMPLSEYYVPGLRSGVADLKNWAGEPMDAIHAALFLQRFVGDTSWVHLDISGVAWRKDSRLSLVPEGASGFGVRLLDRLMADLYPPSVHAN
ncbi:leucyl aminopeptidase [Steroidobacter sp.]|uniref:leucyl aminopeptidase n=1 Tax=Steroidobacter sp. TaxID=1978227 RepID=UPI001A50428B|nr:leucyl aminopeptidase [Steroidobacter sp.]MBL8271399.1 leucyl aminopeptidase [Steroidobacter sp.]